MLGDPVCDPRGAVLREGKGVLGVRYHPLNVDYVTDRSIYLDSQGSSLEGLQEMSPSRG